ncbi:hypothetical protein [Dyella sedimenti]|uniref:hypothetical protein n=1 Tax=Dyella sedimenti TaxID=2919947 RepID=UPI001FAB3144|nr:hypothetical protein [Dyella sedimenti]
MTMHLGDEIVDHLYQEGNGGGIAAEDGSPVPATAPSAKPAVPGRSAPAPRPKRSREQRLLLALARLLAARMR